MTTMTDVPIRNLELLNDLSFFEQCKESDFLKHFYCIGHNFTYKQADYWTGIDYLKEVLKEGHSHKGFPDYLKSYSLQLNTFKLNPDSEGEEYVSLLEKVWSRLEEFKLKNAFKSNALFSVYPPGGFIGWHNNANASAYNIIFTWSESGKGHISFLDSEKKQIVKIPDKPGWQCKVGYFASYKEDPKKLMYHSARNDDWRMTIAFTLDTTYRSKELQKWIIEGISSDQ